MSKKTMLVVDDAPIVRLMIKDIASYNGFEIVGEGCNGLEAIEKYKQLKPDITTLDIIMPEMDGIEALQGILAFDPNARVVMVTAIDQRDSLMKAIRLGAIDYIVKPFESERVVSALNNALK